MYAAVPQVTVVTSTSPVVRREGRVAPRRRRERVTLRAPVAMQSDELDSWANQSLAPPCKVETNMPA